MNWIPPSDLDPEVLALCQAMNALPGIQTVSSCCGHGDHPFRIWFEAESLESLPPLLYWFDVCHSGCEGWRVIASTDCGMSSVSFMVEGPVHAFGQADEIAMRIEAFVATLS